MASESNRNILLPVDDSEVCAEDLARSASQNLGVTGPVGMLQGCERACKWAVEHLYRGGWLSLGSGISSVQLLCL